jgi:hypothetical protein
VNPVEKIMKRAKKKRTSLFKAYLSGWIKKGRGLDGIFGLLAKIHLGPSPILGHV